MQQTGQAATLQAQPQAGQKSGQPAVPAGEDRTWTLPRPGFEEQDQPLGAARKPEAASTSYKFLATNGDGTPVGYSPCRPLHYVVNAALAPPGAGRLVDDCDPDDLRGHRDHSSSMTAPPPRHPPNPRALPKETYGDRWAPLLIALDHAGAGAAAQGPGDRHRRQHALQFR